MTYTKKLINTTAAAILFALISLGGCKKSSDTPPTACFSVSADTIYNYQTASFTNCSESASSYLWSFGDGTTSNETAPIHTFNTGGIFNIQLTATNASGDNKTTKQLFVIEPIAIISPDTDFVRLFPADVQPLSIKFTSPNSIEWVKCLYDVGDDDANYVPTYPNTLFFEDRTSTPANFFTYSGSYTVPDTIAPFRLIRLKFSMKSGTTITDKELRIESK